MQSFDYIQSGKRTVQLERDAIATLEQRIGEGFKRACDMILACKGRVVVTGMGKSGHIGHKIAATLARWLSPFPTREHPQKSSPYSRY